MSSIGPQLPPHLSKRKRSSEDESQDSPPAKTTRPSNEDEIALDDSSDSDDGYGPSAPPRAVGPTMPPHTPTPTTTRPSMGPAMPTTSINTDDNDEDDAAATGPAPAPPALRRTHGPAPPPASLSERPSPPPSDSDDSDDDYGPALPTAASRGPIGPSLPPPTTAAPERLQRDDWMLAPPSASNGYQERDTTKIKSRKFASGATATTRPKDGAGISSIWTETPEEKAKRLADAVLGRGSAADREQQATSRGGASGVSGLGERRDDKKIQAFTEQTRGKSLYEQHQAAKKAGKASGGGSGGSGKQEGDEEDDDPSKRAFDREKDMGLGGKITASQRKELLNRASDFGGRFSKGNYL